MFIIVNKFHEKPNTNKELILDINKYCESKA